MSINKEFPSESSSTADNTRELVELLALIAIKDQLALQQLYRATSSQLFGILLRILRSNTAAEDALQDTFIKIWIKAGDYQEENGQPLTWMTSIARYHALDVLRSDKTTRQRDTRYVLESEESPARLTSFENELVNSELINKCLHRLDPHVRELVVDAYCGGYTHRELSYRSDTPAGTIKTWIRRALSSLRECIDELS